MTTLPIPAATVATAALAVAADESLQQGRRGTMSCQDPEEKGEGRWPPVADPEDDPGDVPGKKGWTFLQQYLSLQCTREKTHQQEGGGVFPALQLPCSMAATG